MTTPKKMPPLVIDISSNQQHPIEWSKVKKVGVKGVILKATQGTSYVNPHFASDLTECVVHGIPVMAYHYATFENPTKEARFFLKHAGARARALDIETSENLTWANDFIKVLQKEKGFVADETMLYGSASSIPRKGLISMLWIADWSASPGKPCALWQYTDKGTVDGIANAVDMSHWLGTQQQFDHFFGV